MKIIAADLSMTGLSHLYFNTAFLKVLNNMYNQPVLFWCEEEHGKAVISSCKEINVEIKTFESKTYNGVSVFFQDFLQIMRVSSLLFFARKEDQIYILNRLPFTLLWCNLINLFFRRNICNILHGELEYLVNPQTNGGTKYYYQIFRLAYKLSISKSKYLFLGESIKRIAFNKGISFGKATLLSIDHPYEYPQIHHDKCMHLFNPKCSIGIIGSAMIRKNSHYLEELSNLINRTDISFVITGKVEPFFEKFCIRNGIAYNKLTLNSEEYERMNLGLQYSLCFYDEKINLALASGSFFDSIKYCKPLLALKGNPYIDYYFEKLGNIGYRFNSIKEMSEFINGLSDKETSNYDSQVASLRDAQLVLSIESISNRLLNELKVLV